MKPITGKRYDQLKFIAQILLPGLGTLYVALAAIWGLPASEQVAGTILAVDTFLGGVLQLSSNAYANSEDRFDGAMINHGKGVFSLHTDLDGNQMEDRKEIVLKVTDPPTVDKDNLRVPKPTRKRRPHSRRPDSDVEEHS